METRRRAASRGRFRQTTQARLLSQIHRRSCLAAEIVTSLRSTGVVVALATNQQAYRAAFMAHQLRYRSLFDHLLFSCELGHTKPSNEYFLAALASVHFDPNEALFIDDHKANVVAAGGCGLSAEMFHVSEGVGRIQEILYRYGLLRA